ncbi:MAG: CBS domain-containing protein [Desulfobulbus sp.]|jgi:CBS-domain-containing membrane protein|uniref:CBS domain-containing protein n=1 Tax=Desulfobulbus sp. TaxID=895 RepID=UPI00283C946D|nr:CBS domain-containing protein [Desulfobulbus sp.]MDR2550915.1 CBS domain-containing protein [Desulfobulbus sp.]
MLKAKDIMTREVITVKESATVRDLAALLLTSNISGVPVVDDDGKVIGVVTESDLIFQNKKVHLPTAFALLDAFVFLERPGKMEQELKKMAGSKVGDICSRKLVSVTPETELDELATLMAEKNIHTLPVMNEGQLVGVIGKSDIIRTIAQGM